MNRILTRVVPVAALSLVAVFAVAVATASAHGGRGGPLRAERGEHADALVTQAAKELGVTRAKLVDAIADAARARIDEAVSDDDLDKEDAADLKEEVADNVRLAMAISRTRTVASNLGVTTAKLNQEFRDARKAVILAEIEEALAEDRIDKERADELKDELADAGLPGYKAGFGLGGRGHGLGGFGGGPFRR